MEASHAGLFPQPARLVIADSMICSHSQIVKHMTEFNRLTAALADRYAIQEELGESAMASVRLA